MQVTCPEGVSPGQVIQVAAPQVAQPIHESSVTPLVAAGSNIDVNSPGDRRTRHDGATALKNPGLIRVSDWEVAQPNCWEQCCLALRCAVVDTSRSYIYIRDNNSLELNDNNNLLSCVNCCNCCCETPDDTRVEYFDRPPWTTTCKRVGFPWCCCFTCDTPKLEVFDTGCLICCIHCHYPTCCYDEKIVVIMPFEYFPFPCCCCPNRACWLDNCCGCCGSPTGNPKIFNPFRPQPKAPETFVAVAKAAMRRDGAQHRVINVGVPEGEEMER